MFNGGDEDISYDLYKEIYEFLAQPEEEGLTRANREKRDE